MAGAPLPTLLRGTYIFFSHHEDGRCLRLKLVRLLDTDSCALALCCFTWYIGIPTSFWILKQGTALLFIHRVTIVLRGQTGKQDGKPSAHPGLCKVMRQAEHFELHHSSLCDKVSQKIYRIYWECLELGMHFWPHENCQVFTIFHMEVSCNRGTPKSSIWQGFSINKPFIYVEVPPFMETTTCVHLFWSIDVHFNRGRCGSCGGHGSGDPEDVERASADDSPGAASAGPSGATWISYDLMNYPMIIWQTWLP